MIGASLNVPSDRSFLKGWKGRPAGSRWWAYHLVLKGHVFGVVFLKPFFSGVLTGEDLDVLGVPNLLTRVDVNKDGHRRTIL